MPFFFWSLTALRTYVLTNSFLLIGMPEVMKHLSYRIVDVSSVKVSHRGHESSSPVSLRGVSVCTELTERRRLHGDGTLVSSSVSASRDRRRASTGESPVSHR